LDFFYNKLYSPLPGSIKNNVTETNEQTKRKRMP